MKLFEQYYRVWKQREGHSRHVKLQSVKESIESFRYHENTGSVKVESNRGTNVREIK